MKFLEFDQKRKFGNLINFFDLGVDYGTDKESLRRRSVLPARPHSAFVSNPAAIGPFRHQNLPSERNLIHYF